MTGTWRAMAWQAVAWQAVAWQAVAGRGFGRGCVWLGAGAMLAASTLAGLERAHAQPQLATLPPSASADPATIWTLQGENSSISSARLTDRYYTNGIRLGFTSGTDDVPDVLQNLSRAVFGAGQQRFTVDITQQIYTPKDTETGNPPPSDRPFAGLLLANLGLVTDTADTRSTLGLSLGLIGPDALGRQVQNGFHDAIGQDDIHGWHTQLHDEPVFELLSSRTWRLPVASFAGLQVDALPEVTAGLGTVRIYAEGGAQIRLGQGLDSDFGTARIRPGISGGDVFKPTRPFVWYVFAGADGQVVGRDITLDGNTWRDSRSVTLKPLVGEFQGGLAIEAFGMRLAYTHVLQTDEFKHQKGGLHQFGSLALSVRF